MAVTAGPPPRRSGLGSLAGGLAAVAAVYLMAAYIFALWPMAGPGPVACRGAGVAYQVFVDPTGSNLRRGNWISEGVKFIESLNACDVVSFFEIGNNTSGASRHGDLVRFPAIDVNAANPEIVHAEAEVAAKRVQAKAYLTELVDKHGAVKSDIVGVFNKLSPVPGAGRNVLVILSDGQESGHKLNLENGQRCVSVENLRALVDLALEGRARSEGLGHVDEIKWLVPAAAGVAGCNSRDELKVFWSALISRLGGGRSPALSFDTNVFSMQGGKQ
jgi:hypothetical protein